MSMPLADDVNSFLKNERDGQRFWGNAVGGAHDGLYDLSNAENLISAAIRNASAFETPDAATNVRTFTQSIAALRFHEVPSHRPEIMTDFVPMPRRDLPDLSGQMVYSVTTLWGLRRAMSQDDISRLAAAEIPLKMDGTVDDEDEFRSALALLTPEQATFSVPPNEGLGRFIVWFTTEACIASARSRCSYISDPIPLAEALRARNGLGHRRAGEWLALLKIPGDVITRSGHYRPVFCDGGMGADCWFMARSSDVSSFHGGDWGQTCDLEPLENGSAIYDGSHERVAIQPRSEHLGTDRIGFEVLGPTVARFGSIGALDRLTAGIWSRKSL